MSELDRIGEIVARANVAGRIPGVVAAAGRGPVTLGTWTAGLADTTPGAPGAPGRPMVMETVFDLASLTKIVSTTTVVLSLAASGALSLDSPVARYLPAAPWEVTVRQLLAHTSGLPGSVKFYEWCDTRAALLDALYGTALEAPPGTRVAYSDLGFMVLGEMISAVTGSPLDTVFRQTVSEPLAMADTRFLPDGPPSRFAATEFRDDGTPWTGVVHDENARVMGGVAGHAGLFGTVTDLARFASWWVSPGSGVGADACAGSGAGSRAGSAAGSGSGANSGAGAGSGPGADDGPVPAALRREAETCQTPGLKGDGGNVLPRPTDPDRPPGGHRGLGWVKPGDRFDILAGAWPRTAVSHTGFTGTSIALDSASGAWLILLTNRVHASRDPTAIRAFRRAAHTAAAKALLRLPAPAPPIPAPQPCAPGPRAPAPSAPRSPAAPQRQQCRHRCGHIMYVTHTPHTP